MSEKFFDFRGIVTPRERSSERTQPELSQNKEVGRDRGARSFASLPQTSQGKAQMVSQSYGFQTSDDQNRGVESQPQAQRIGRTPSSFQGQSKSQSYPLLFQKKIEEGKSSGSSIQSHLRRAREQQHEGSSVSRSSTQRGSDRTGGYESSDFSEREKEKTLVVNTSTIVNNPVVSAASKSDSVHDSTAGVRNKLTYTETLSALNKNMNLLATEIGKTKKELRLVKEKIPEQIISSNNVMKVHYQTLYHKVEKLTSSVSAVDKKLLEHKSDINEIVIQQNKQNEILENLENNLSDKYEQFNRELGREIMNRMSTMMNTYNNELHKSQRQVLDSV